MQDENTDIGHVPVLLRESLELLNIEKSGLYVDATVGLGGHSEAILDANAENRLIGIDQDREALAAAGKRLERFGSRVRLVHSNYSAIAEIIDNLDWGRPDGILADLGVSSLQFDSASRGFSLRHDAELDMRMDADSDRETAAELLATLDEAEIADIIYRYGEERASRKIARWIVNRRNEGRPVTTTLDLADLVKRAVRQSPQDRTHPATRTFQALRIAVNEEFDNLERFLDDAVEVLADGGRLAVITFHSLEDRIVKQAFQRRSGKCSCPPRMPVCRCGAVKKVEILTRKPILPTAEEMRQNSRSRSAKLRACRKKPNSEVNDEKETDRPGSDAGE